MAIYEYIYIMYIMIIHGIQFHLTIILYVRMHNKYNLPVLTVMPKQVQQIIVSVVALVVLAVSVDRDQLQEYDTL